MTPQQVDLVQRSWRAVLPVGDTAAELFYGKLFSLDPSIRPLFRDDLREQGRNLTSMISVAVGSLSRPSASGSPCSSSASAMRRTASSRAITSSSRWRSSSCSSTCSPATYTNEVREAWMGVYRLLATTMQEACAYS